MPGYAVKHETVRVGDTDFLIRSLLDVQQYADPEGDAEREGVPEAGWGLFGKVWPSARVLALSMIDFDIAGKRILEIGAGLALSSLVLHHRHGNVTVSDWHPLGQAFLDENVRLNHMSPMKYRTGNWESAITDLGQFDLIIGSDILYERQQPEQIANFINRHAAPGCQIIIVDPDRGNRAGFCREMAARGYGFVARKAPLFLENGDSYKGRFLDFSHPLPAAAQ